MKPEEYEAWYHTVRGDWVGNTEFQLLQQLLKSGHGESLLDVGCGTGHFSRRFAHCGMRVSGIDPNAAMLDFAASQNQRIAYQRANAENLPFADASFDHVTAITSLCFVQQPLLAVMQMWRVCRKSMVLGLLNRYSLLYQRKADRNGYRGARWDSRETVNSWLTALQPAPVATLFRTCIFLPGYQSWQRCLERFIPQHLPFGAFLAVKIIKPRS
jgi:SAM-dependent methyltransferase